MATDDHEMYPNAPVALVAAEIAFPGEIGSPLTPGVQRAVGDVLGDEWVVEPIQSRAVSFNNLGVAQPLLQPGLAPTGAILRFADRARTSAVAFTSGTVSIETTQYRNWPAFRSILATAVVATERLLRPTGVVRVGLRYIDEIRVVGVEASGWADWLSPTVLPPAATSMVAAGWPPILWAGAAQYGIGEDRSLTLRYGQQGAQPGFVVNPDGPLRRPGERPEGPFFLLDFDASWQPTVVPRWDSELVLVTFDELRQPVRALFYDILSDRIVNDVFKNKKGVTE